MNQEEILNFIATLDHRLLAAAAVLLLLLLLFWRVLRRTSRIEREVARLNERMERIREEVRSIAEPNPLSVAPANEVPETIKEVPATIKTEQAPPEEPDLIEEQPEEEDVLSRAVASLAEANAEEDLGTAEGDTDFSFDQDFAEDPNELASPVEEPAAPADEDSFSFGETEEAPAPVEESVAPAAAEPEPEMATSGVVSLEGDPARPGVSLVRCLSCNYKLAYPEKLSGKRVRCPSCRTGLDLP